MKAAAIIYVSCALGLVRASTAVAETASPAVDKLDARWIQPTITYTFTSDIPDYLTSKEVQDAIEAAFETWQSIEGFPLLFESQGYYHIVLDGGNVWTVLVGWTYDPWEHTESRMAHTKVEYDPEAGVIFAAAIVLNGRDFYWSTAGHPTRVDLQSILTHEVGHLLGLPNSGAPDATMYKFAKVGETKKRTLAQSDIDAALELYDSPLIDEHALEKLTGNLADGGLGPGCHATAGAGVPRSATPLVLLLGAAAATLLRLRRNRHPHTLEGQDTCMGPTTQADTSRK